MIEMVKNRGREPGIARLDCFQVRRCVESWQDCVAWAGSERQWCVGVAET